MKKPQLPVDGPHARESVPPGARHPWLDTAKGICIVAVVTMYTCLHVSEALGSVSWLQYWVDFARPFRMPDFFFISGLLLHKVIDRPWPQFADRKVLHYLYFFVVWSLLYFAARELSGRPPDDGRSSTAEFIKVMTWGPFAMLWFIQMLPFYLVLTRLLRRVPWPLVLAGAVLWHLAPIDTPWTQVDRAGERYVFFFAGYVFARATFAYAGWVSAHRRAGLCGILAWAIVNEACVLWGLAAHPAAGIVLGFAGALGVIATAVLLQPLRGAGWLRACGEHSLPIYVGFYLPMSLLLNVLLHVTRPHPPVPFDPGTLALLLAAVSIAVALGVERRLRHTWLGWLYARPRWARWGGGAREGKVVAATTVDNPGG